MAIPDSERVDGLVRTHRCPDGASTRHGYSACTDGVGVRWHGSRAIEVYIHVSTLPLATLDTLRQHGVRVLRSDAQYAMIYALMSIDTLEAVATLPFVRCIDLPAYSVRRTGSVTSEGDTGMRVDLVRATLGVMSTLVGALARARRRNKIRQVWCSTLSTPLPCHLPAPMHSG
jgi:hypothetical protein